LVNDPENPNEDEVYQLAEVTGIVRAGEKENWLLGQRNWPAEGNYGFIDLPYMVRMFRLFNYDSASTAYLERTIESYDEDSESNYPIPATKDTFFKPRWMPKNNLELATIFGGVSLISLTSLILNAAR